MEINKKLIEWISSGIISIILINLGLKVISQDKYLGIMSAIIGFALLYISYYSVQIRINEKKIRELEEWKEAKEELLNTLKDIVMLKKVSRIK